MNRNKYLLSFLSLALLLAGCGDDKKGAEDTLGFPAANDAALRSLQNLPAANVAPAVYTLRSVVIRQFTAGVRVNYEQTSGAARALVAADTTKLTWINTPNRATANVVLNLPMELTVAAGPGGVGIARFNNRRSYETNTVTAPATTYRPTISLLPSTIGVNFHAAHGHPSRRLNGQIDELPAGHFPDPVNPALAPIAGATSRITAKSLNANTVVTFGEVRFPNQNIKLVVECTYQR